MPSTHVSMTHDGRLIRPASARQALGLPHGGALIVRIEGDVVMLKPMSHAIARPQAMVKPYTVPG